METRTDQAQAASSLPVLAVLVLVCLVALCCAAILSGCSSMPGSQKLKTADPGFLEVAASPQAFDGQAVTLRGWVSLRTEDRNLWATRTDHEAWRTDRCISLSMSAAMLNEVNALDGRVVEVTGVVSRDGSNGGSVIRMGACRDAAIAVSGLRLVGP